MVRLYQNSFDSFVALSTETAHSSFDDNVQVKVNLCRRQVCFNVTRYVDNCEAQEAIAVFPNVPLTFVSKFLVNYLLMHGSYLTELNMFTCASLSEAYMRAGLVDCRTISDEALLNLTNISS